MDIWPHSLKIFYLLKYLRVWHGVRWGLELPGICGCQPLQQRATEPLGRGPGSGDSRPRPGGCGSSGRKVSIHSIRAGNALSPSKPGATEGRGRGLWTPRIVTVGKKMQVLGHTRPCRPSTHSLRRSILKRSPNRGSTKCAPAVINRRGPSRCGLSLSYTLQRG